MIQSQRIDLSLGGDGMVQSTDCINDPAVQMVYLPVLVAVNLNHCSAPGQLMDPLVLLSSEISVSVFHD